MDNEASADIKHAMLKYKVDYQVTPPFMHRINAAEHTIRPMYKNHFLIGLNSVNPSFPINKRVSHQNPNVSTYAFLHGNYDFNKHPIVLEFLVCMQKKS